MAEMLSSVATAAGVLIAAWQLRRSVLQAKIDFEDDLNKEYRELLRRIPFDAQFGGDLDDRSFKDALPDFHRYFDLSNEQIFLRMNGRISKVTWTDWSDGIKANISKPAFARAWAGVIERTNSFSELRRLHAAGFSEDPYVWVSRTYRFKRWLRQ